MIPEKSNGGLVLLVLFFICYLATPQETTALFILTREILNTKGFCFSLHITGGVPLNEP